MERLGDALREAYPELAEIAAVAAEPTYVVGGAVRDLLLGRGRADLDLVVEGDAEVLAAALGAEPLANHDRFGTVKLALGGHTVDIAAARSETYAAPGALPTVSLGATIEADLGRRDFTINAIALPVDGNGGTIDPHGGAADLERGWLRVLHERSFVDDPTRAIRAARYAARLDLALEAETERLLRETDLATVSEDRRQGELRRLATEPTAPAGFELLSGWGVVVLSSRWDVLAAALPELLSESPWTGEIDPAEAWLAAALGPDDLADDLTHAHPTQPSQAVSLADRRDPTELLLARALGAEWLDDYVGVWRHVALEIDGADLIAAGVPEGQALGRGLDAALKGKLDGEISGREAELAAALAAARAD